MLYLALGGVALALFLWSTGGKLRAPRREWRIVGGALALAAFTAAAYLGARGGWGAAIVLVVLGLGLAVSARKDAPPPVRPREPMSADEARRILGVGPEASREDIQAAYSRLMRMAHPDRGGTAGLAAQLNAARDRLLKR